jgi:hypothetical protein
VRWYVISFVKYGWGHFYKFIWKMIYKIEISFYWNVLLCGARYRTVVTAKQNNTAILLHWFSLCNHGTSLISFYFFCIFIPFTVSVIKFHKFNLKRNQNLFIQHFFGFFSVILILVQAKHFHTCPYHIWVCLLCQKLLRWFQVHLSDVGPNFKTFGL